MKNTKLLYIGNKLYKHGYNKTTIETLGAKLSDESFEVVFASEKKNQWIRFLDMIFTTLLKAPSVDYVLIDTYSTTSFWYAFFCSQIARIFKVKYIPILHGGNLPERLQRNPKISKAIFGKAYQNVTPSHYLFEQFQNFGFQNLVYIPNAIVLDQYLFLNRKIEAPKLIWIRSLAQIYNPKMAITVLAELQQEYPNATLCMVGPDKENLLDECKQYAAQLGVDVLFTGKLSNHDLLQLTTKYSIFINTTHFDNMPVSLIEAMALGLPIVSTNVGGIPYLLEDKKEALLVADNDVFGMVSCIKQLMIDEKNRSEMVQEARKKVATYDWNIVKKKWVALLQ